MGRALTPCASFRGWAEVSRRSPSSSSRASGRSFAPTTLQSWRPLHAGATARPLHSPATPPVPGNSLRRGLRRSECFQVLAMGGRGGIRGLALGQCSEGLRAGGPAGRAADWLRQEPVWAVPLTWRGSGEGGRWLLAREHVQHTHKPVFTSEHSFLDTVGIENRTQGNGRVARPLPHFRVLRTRPGLLSQAPADPDGRARARSFSRVRTALRPCSQSGREVAAVAGSRARPSAEWGWGLWVNGRVSGGGRGGASRMNERNVPRARRRARPGRGANGSAGRARDPALRATAARRLEGERRQAGARVAGRAWSVRGPRAASQRPDGTAGRRRRRRRREPRRG